MFEKAQIEIFNLNLNDIIVTSEIWWGDDDIFMGGLTDEEQVKQKRPI